CIGKVIAVKIWRGDDVEILRPRQNLLKCDVGNRIFDEQRTAFDRGPLLIVGGGFAFLLLRPLPTSPGINFVAENPLGGRITPVAKRAFSVLHDVPLVDERNIAATEANSVFNGCLYQANGTD